MLCTAQRWKMMEISNALHFYCSFLPCLMPSPCTTMHDHAPCSNCRKSHLWHALPSAKFTSFPRALQEERWATPSTHPSAPGQWGSLLTMEQSFVGARRSKGCLPAGLACSLVGTSCWFAAICTGLQQQMELQSSWLLQTATCLGLNTFPQPTTTSLVITPASLGLV